MGSCLSIDDSAATTENGGVHRSYSDYLLSESKKGNKLSNIPGRMHLNGASSVASLFTKQGKKGPNQDAMIVWEDFNSTEDTIFCGVFDGHGPNGHIVARKVRDSLPQKLSSHWQEFTVKEITNSTAESPTSEEESRQPFNLEENENCPEIFTTLKESFLKAFKVMDKELKVHPSINCFCSGTTAVTLVKQGQDLVIGNLGDSRAVLATRDENDSLVAVQLTVDLKPNLPKEEERIKQSKGRVFALRNEPDVARVWLPKSDSPGLAMARAFGDFCIKDFGLISVPEISYRRLTENDEFIVLATDGIWDVLSNEEVVEIVASSSSRSSSASTLVEAAVHAWRRKYPTSKVDDCAAVCLYLRNTAYHSSNSDVNHSASDIKNDSFLSEILEEEHKGKGKGNGGKDWTALEGVSRVNTLLTLPRFDTSLN